MNANNMPASVVRIIGVGGAGCSAAHYMLSCGLAGTDCVIMNTDAQAVRYSECPHKVHLGEKHLKGRGPVSIGPELGRLCADDSRDEIIAMLGGARIVFIVAGLGGETGTGATPVIAGIAQELGILTVCLVTTPFSFEGKKRMENAQRGIDALRDTTDYVLIFPNENLRKDADPGLPLQALFERSNAALYQSMQYLMGITGEPGYISSELDTVRQAVQNLLSASGSITDMTDVDSASNNNQTIYDNGTVLTDIIGGNIKIGDVLFGAYRVESEPIQGVSSKVYRVRHIETGKDHALKCIRPDVFNSEEHREKFVSRCEAVMNLEPHSHILCNDGLLNHQGALALISEWMDGGTLKDWILNGKLYEDNKDVTLSRILDIAIQFARGLQYLHGQKHLHFVHESVCPNSLLLTAGGDAKLISPNGSIEIVKAGLEVKDDIRVNVTGYGCGAYIPAYCSPEQMKDETVHKTTDIYSWAVSVLEMFLGERLWQSGVVAGAACEEYFSMNMKVRMPKGVKGLLRLCLAEDPEKRPHDFCVVEAALLRIYQTATGRIYPRMLEEAKDDKTVFDGGITLLDLRNADITADTGAATAENDTTVQENNAVVFNTEIIAGANDVIIEKGAVLLDTYQVEADAIQGGMGKVWRVRHTGWNVDLAMKQPKAELFQNEQQKAEFIRECEAWINLGLHPQIVSCYYVRDVGGIPSIFSEWMEGGSLKNWIYNGELYHGDAQAALERVLDIAIQFARGLHYAHEQDLIHQDVKPDNLLLTPEGEAKVADFGLARARAMLTVQNNDVPADTTMVSDSGAYTFAYCSMEQLNGEVLTRRTDIYSWAVSILEIFLGKRLWQSGVVAGAACEDYFRMDMRVIMPEGVKELLRRCLDKNPEKRPHDFDEIDAALLRIYQDAIGNAYPREASKAAADTADSLNNRALSFLDLGRPEEAEDYWKKALALSPQHCPSLYNQSLHLWRGGKITDIEALNKVESGDGSVKQRYLAQLHLERCAPDKALNALEELPAEDEDAAALHQSAREMLEQGECVTVLRDVLGDVPDIKLDNIPRINEDGSLNEAYFRRSAPPIDIKEYTVSEDGAYMLVITRENPKAILLYDVQTGNRLQSLVCAEEPLCMCFSSDNTLVVAGDGNYVAIWETRTGERAGELKLHRKQITSLAFNGDGRWLLSCDEDGCAVLWDVHKRRLQQIYVDGMSISFVGCLSRDGKRVLTGNKIGTIRVWGAESDEPLCRDEGEKPLLSFDGFPTSVYNICMDEDNGRILASGVFKACLFDAHNGALLGEVDNAQFSSVSTRCFEIDPNRVLVIGTRDAVIDIYTGRYLQTFDDPVVSEGNEHRYFPDGRTLIFIKKHGIQLALATLPSFRYQSSFDLCRVVSSKTTIKLEQEFRKREQEIYHCLDNGDVAAALEMAGELGHMPVWGRSGAMRQICREIGKYCIKKKISQIAQVDVSRWAAALYEGGFTEHYSISPERRSIAFMYVSYTKKNPDGVERVFIVIHRIHTGEVIAKFEIIQEMIQKEGNLVDLVFNLDGSRLLAIFSKESVLTALLSLDNPWTGRIYNYDTGAEEQVFTAESSEVLIRQAQDMGFYWRQGEAYISSGNLYFLEREPLQSRYCCCFRILDAGGNVRIDLPKREKDAITALFSADGNQIEIAYRPCNIDDNLFEYVTYEIEWEYHFPGWTNWDDGALPYLENFIARYPEEYANEDFNSLLMDLQNHGYGYIRPEGVRIKLDELRFGW